MIVGILREAAKDEARVAGTPSTVAKLLGLGYGVIVEAGAGTRASFSDAAYREVGADIGDPCTADVVLGVNIPTLLQLDGLHPGSLLVSLLAPALNPEFVSDLASRGVTALAMDAVPRISRAQSLDVLSSMANIAGYRAVIEAAHAFGRLMTGQITAAGKVPPAEVLVAGVGVAGLAAIGTASSLGAVVRATDPRAEVADQVTSVGGVYLSVEVETEQSTDGYARATSEEYDRRAAELYSEQAARADIVITTALIPGRPAPRLLTEKDVASMKPGSVVVDMAAAQGGNVAGTVAGQAVVTDNGVTLIGYTDLAGRLPAQASQLYGTNLVNLMKLLTPAKDGQVTLDLDDVVQRAIAVAHNGEVLWPPPAIAVSATPTTALAVSPSGAPPLQRVMSRPLRLALIAAGVVALFLLNAVAPAPLPEHVTVLVLAVVIGYYVIGKVHHALHTPLMSVTNAISGIIVVGAMLQLDQDDAAIRVLSFIAILLASINVFGGFAVTRRMLNMFSRG